MCNYKFTIRADHEASYYINRSTCSILVEQVPLNWDVLFLIGFEGFKITSSMRLYRIEKFPCYVQIYHYLIFVHIEKQQVRMHFAVC